MYMYRYITYNRMVGTVLYGLVGRKVGTGTRSADNSEILLIMR